MRTKMTAIIEPMRAFTSSVETSGSTETTGLIVDPVPPLVTGFVMGSSDGSTGAAVGATVETTGSTPGHVDTTGAHATPVSHSSVVTMAAPPRKL